MAPGIVGKMLQRSRDRSNANRILMRVSNLPEDVIRHGIGQFLFNKSKKSKRRMKKKKKKSKRRMKKKKKSQNDE